MTSPNDLKSQTIRDAATIILSRNGAFGPEVLMGQRGASAVFMPNKFVFPGGAVDPADLQVDLASPLDPLSHDRLAAFPLAGGTPDLTPTALAAAALRELWEETGVTEDLVEVVAKTEDWVTYDLPAHLLGKVWGGKYRGQKQKWFLLRFKGTDDQVKIASEHPEFSEWKWIKADAMVEGIVPFKRAVYEQVVAEFRDHLA